MSTWGPGISDAMVGQLTAMGFELIAHQRTARFKYDYELMSSYGKLGDGMNAKKTSTLSVFALHSLRNTVTKNSVRTSFHSQFARVLTVLSDVGDYVEAKGFDRALTADAVGLYWVAGSRARYRSFDHSLTHAARLRELFSSSADVRAQFDEFLGANASLESIVRAVEILQVDDSLAPGDFTLLFGKRMRAELMFDVVDFVRQGEGLRIADFVELWDAGFTEDSAFEMLKDSVLDTVPVSYAKQVYPLRRKRGAVV
jgi:hypothetical protein